jgi:molybdopterin/thiamine biosynthesis adenylyltransferase
MLSPEEIQLYARHLGIPAWGPRVQERLRRSKAFVAGAGGLGSPVLYYLAAAGVGNLVVCDYDRVEVSNLNRQILHAGDRIGVHKADSAAKTIAGINPFVNVAPMCEKITGRNAARLIGDADLIIDCLDNFQTRHTLNAVSVKNRIPMIHAGVSGFSGQVTLLSPPETACLACFIEEKKTRGTNYVAGAAAGVIGSIEAVEAIKYLAGFGSTLKNRLLFWDGLTMAFESVTLKKNPRCRVCKNA